MKSGKISIAYFILTVLLFAACEKDPFEGVVSNERAIAFFKLDEGQVGEAEIIRTADESKVIVYYSPGTDLANLKPNIMTSYKAKISPASGEVVNFQTAGGKVVYTVTSESGEQRQWTVEAVEYDFQLKGTWKVSAMNFWYWIGEGESWGWQEPDRPLKWNLPDAEAEEDNILTLEVNGVNEAGKPIGTYTFSEGADAASAAFVYHDGTDYKYKFRKLPIGAGTFVVNTTTLTFNPGQANEVETLPFTLSNDDKTLKLPFSPGPYDIDWSGDGNKQHLGGAKQVWYVLQKQ
jgi:hypothetical protein